jgi:flavodoxin
MRTIVAYESRYGNTAEVAESISESLQTTGPVQLVALSGDTVLELEGVDLLVVGGPTEGHGASPTLKAALERLPDGALSGVQVAAFDTRLHWPLLLSGSAAKAVATIFERKGGVMAVPPESFFIRGKQPRLVEGEAERAGAWAQRLLLTLQATSHVRS